MMIQLLPLRAVTRYYRNHSQLIDGYARFAEGERVMHKEGFRGTVQALFGPGPEFTRMVVRFDNGVEMVAEDRDLRVTASHPVVLAVAERFMLADEFVASALNDSPEAMAERDRYCAPTNGTKPETGCPQYPRYTPRIASWQTDPLQAYIDYIDVVDPHEVTPLEAEDGIRNHPTFRRYVGWYKAGHVPPYLLVFEQIRDGSSRLFSANRRRILAAREAGIDKVPAWLGRWNRETGLPLKYGDIVAAATACCARWKETA